MNQIKSKFVIKQNSMSDKCIPEWQQRERVEFNNGIRPFSQTWDYLKTQGVSYSYYSEIASRRYTLCEAPKINQIIPKKLITRRTVHQKYSSKTK